VSEALIVKIAKKLGFEGFRQLREALGENNRVSQATLHEELSVAEGASRQSSPANAGPQPMVLRYNIPTEGMLIRFDYEESRHDYCDTGNPKVELHGTGSSSPRLQSSLPMVQNWFKNAVAPARATPNLPRRYGDQFRCVHHSGRVRERAG
jgi:hypothetical protein